MASVNFRFELAGAIDFLCIDPDENAKKCPTDGIGGGDLTCRS